MRGTAATSTSVRKIHTTAAPMRHVLKLSDLSCALATRVSMGTVRFAKIKTSVLQASGEGPKMTARLALQRGRGDPAAL